MRSCEEKLRGNVIKFYFYRIMSRFYFYLPILVVFFLKQNLNYFEVGLLLACYGLTLTVFEMPAGYLADKTSNKMSIFMGEIIKTLGLLCLAFLSFNIWYLILGQVLCGLGYVLASGADSSLLCKTFNQLGKPDEYQNHEAGSHGYLFLAILISGVMGGFLADIDIRIPLLATVPFSIISSIIALSFVEPEIKKNEKKKPDSFNLRSIMNTIKEKPKILFFSLYYSIIRAVVLATFVGFLPIYFTFELKVELFLYGIILGLFTLVALVTGKNARYFLDKFKEPAIVLTITLTLITAFGILAFFRHNFILGVLLPSLFGCASGFIRPLAIAKINELVSDEERATVLSFAETLYGLFNSLILILVSLVFQLKGLDLGFVCLSAFAVTLILLSLPIMLKNNMTSIIENKNEREVV